jgi:hypothetical protein
MKLAAIALACVALSFPALAQERTPAPQGARVYIIAPQDGATVSSPVTVIFGLEGLGVAPAGVEKSKTGHHHLIIDADAPPPDAPVPSDENHRHFGGGQTQATVVLAPGRHTLQLVMGDHNHVPHEPPIVSRKISITVK